ncbi:MAG: hypothetical protein ABL983_09735 [Nitrospira sp.]
MGCINLRDLTQFLEDLRRDHRLVDRSLVRVELENEWFWSSNIRIKRLTVTARIRQDILRLDLFSDPLSGNHEHDDLHAQAMSRQLDELREACQELGIEIRRGILEQDAVLV